MGGPLAMGSGVVFASPLGIVLYESVFVGIFMPHTLIFIL